MLATLRQEEATLVRTNQALLADALVAAVEGLAPEVVGAEVWFRGVVSGTYPLHVIAANHAQIATHAANTTAAIFEGLAAPDAGG